MSETAPTLGPFPTHNRPAVATTVGLAQRAIADRPDFLDARRATEVPTVVVAGEEDTVHIADEAAEAARTLPRGRLVAVPDAGRLPPLETSDGATDLGFTGQEIVEAHFAACAAPWRAVPDRAGIRPCWRPGAPGVEAGWWPSRTWMPP